MTHQRTLILAALAAGLTAAVACGARSEIGAQDRASSRTSITTSSVGSGGSGGEGGTIHPEGGNAPECVTFNSEAALAPLDLFIMLDSSGSMGFQSGPQDTKWQAVRSAFEQFVTDPESEKIGVALSFFPIIDNDEPRLCEATVAPCGNPNNCKPITLCETGFVLCDDAQDCADQGFPGDACIPLGICSNSPETQCLPTEPGFECPAGFGSCLPAGTCWDHFTCEAGPYSSPQFGVEKLPGAAGGFVATVDGQQPDGGTPTLPALEGAVAAAANFKAANPGHTTVVVLTTDGLPTVCDQTIDGPDPNAPINNLAAVAASAQAQDIQVWVIGVFSAEEQQEAQVNLDIIASAGGTGNAFIVESSGQASSDFLAAMNEVRQNALACDFELLSGDGSVDWTDVWIRVSENGGEQLWIPRVDSEQDCVVGEVGFYYDTPVGDGQIPSVIHLCDGACELVADNPEQTIEVFSACEDPTE